METLIEFVRLVFDAALSLLARREERRINGDGT